MRACNYVGWDVVLPSRSSSPAFYTSSAHIARDTYSDVDVDMCVDMRVYLCVCMWSEETLVCKYYYSKKNRYTESTFEHKKFTRNEEPVGAVDRADR